MKTIEQGDPEEACDVNLHLKVNVLTWQIQSILVSAILAWTLKASDPSPWL